MSDLPRRVDISEEGPREGFQIEPGPIATDRKVALIDALSQTGLRHIQIASFVDPRRVPGMADADAIAEQFTPAPGVEYSAIWFNDKGLDRARASGKLTLAGKLRSYASEAFLKRNLNRTPAEHLAYTHAEIARLRELGIPIVEASITAAFGCNFQGDIPLEKVMSEVEWLVGLAREYDIHLDMLSLADTMAWGNPMSIKRTVGAIRDKHPELPLSLHLHDTRGLGIANAAAGLEMGVELFDTSIGGLGGCPFAAHKGAAGNVSTEDFAFLCEEMGIETGLDLDALIDCARLAEEVVGHPLPGCVMRGGTLTALRSALRATAKQSS